MQALEELAPLASLPLLSELRLLETPLVGPVEGVEDVTPLDNCRVELVTLTLTLNLTLNLSLTLTLRT